MIDFVVPCVPVAQPRQRHRVIQKGDRTFAQNYTPTKAPVNAFKAAVQVAAQAEHQGAPLDGPLSLDLQFILPRPKCMTRKRGENAREWRAKKPDFDNLAKSVCDALGGILWRDDAQLVWVTISKFTAAASEQPRVRVIVEEAEPNHSELFE